MTSALSSQKKEIRYQGSYGHGKPGKVIEFKNDYFPGLEKSLKKM